MSSLAPVTMGAVDPLRSAFEAPHHLPYLWEGGSTAALLVHGFPGTPAELRAVGEILFAAGLTVRGMLLPGFGPELHDLGAQTAAKWQGAVEAEVNQLRGNFRRVLLVGNSMGAALALTVAARVPLDGLLLFSPWWRLNSRLLDGAAPLAARVAPSLRPFRGARFDDPRFADFLVNVLYEADLTDPALQAQVRALSLPTRVLLEVRRVGQQGYQAAPGVRAPVVIVHGSADPLAHPLLAAQIAARVPNLVGSVLVNSGHELAHLRRPHERAIAAILTAFANRFDDVALRVAFQGDEVHGQI